MTKNMLRRYIGIGASFCSLWQLQAGAVGVQVSTGSHAKAIYQALDRDVINGGVKLIPGVLTCLLQEADASCYLVSKEPNAIRVKGNQAKNIYKYLLVEEVNRTPIPHPTGGAWRTYEKQVGNLTCTRILDSNDPPQNIHQCTFQQDE